MAEQRFCVDYAKRGTAGCKKCKEKIVKGVCRIGKVVPNPFSESGGDMKEWYHIKCMFEKLERARATTKKKSRTSQSWKAGKSWKTMRRNR